MKKRLLHYEIVREVGRGGMGVVYEARDTHLDRPVAIKVLPADKVSDADRKRRFIQEAKAASALNHPNIVTIYDVNLDDGLDFIVMEYIAGRTLDSLIPSKGLRPPQVLKYAVQVADAMAKAHAAGILHRDLKPSNVMVTGEDRVKILDFGLAKLTDPTEISADDATVTQRPYTEDGSVMGTAAYMSPEQAEGRKLDGRSEIFSFGTVLYEMVCGYRPFESDSRVTLLAKIVNEDPRPLPESVPAPLGKAILRCLRKDPARRFQTMADLKVALEDLEEESASPGAQAVAARSRPRWSAAAILLPMLLVAGFFGWRRLRTLESVEPMTAVPLTTFSGSEWDPTFSPDGNQVAFTWNGPAQDNPDIYVQMIGSGSPLRLTTNPQADISPAWSPDGRWIAFLRHLPGPWRKYELRLVPPLGGPERKLAEVQLRKLISVGDLTARPAWSADSRFLVVTDSPGETKPDALFAIALESGEKRQLTDPTPSTVGDMLPAISPNGRFLVFQRMLALNASELHLLPLGDGLRPAGEIRRLTTIAVGAMTPAWTSGSDEVVFSARGSLWRIGISGALSASATPLPFVGADGIMPAISRPQPGRPSRLVYVRNFADLNIWKVETAAPGAPASAPPSRAISSTREDRGPGFSHDGRRVAFTSTRSGWSEIWLSDPDGSSAVQLTSLEAPNAAAPRWSSDGQTIAFESNLEGQNEVYSISASGGKPRRLTTNPANDNIPSFSRDGKWIYFQSNRSGEPQIWRMPAAGGEATQITRNIGYAALESVDGAWLYYTQTTNQTSALWRVPASGGTAEKILDPVQYRAFDVLEKGIYYIGGDRQDSLRLQFFDFATRKSTTVSPLDRQTRGPGLAASPDGRTILFTRLDSSVTDLMLVENFR